MKLNNPLNFFTLKKIKEKVNIILIFIVITAVNLSAQSGTISGKIVDEKNGEPLIGANILIENTTNGAASDLDGNYLISNLTPGIYNLIVSMISYAKYRVVDVEVKENEVTKLDIALISEAIETDEVVITARMLLNNEAGLLKNRQKSNTVSDAISSEMISRYGSRNAADALAMVTGASVVSSKYIYVRGLGERYSTTHLNGAELPSADPDKKSFNMDLIPANMLDNIVTIKSFTPDKPGNFTGGIIDIGTKSYPEKFTLKISGSSSYNNLTSFNSRFLSYSGGNSDWLGIDDGTRGIPDILKNPDIKIPSSTTARFNSEQAELLDQISKSFFPQMSPQAKTAPLNQNYSLSVGDQVSLFNIPVGLLGSFSYGRDFSFYENGTSGRWKLTGNINSVNSLDELQLLNDTKGTDAVNWGGLVTINLQPSENNEIGTDIIYNRNSQSVARFLEGTWKEQTGNQIFQTRALTYSERSLFSYQMHGKHILNKLNSLEIKWLASISNSLQEEPDARFFTNNYSVNGFNYSIARGNYPLPSRYFREMSEDSKNFNLDLTFPVKLSDKTGLKIKTGGSFNEKERDFFERRFQYELGEIRYNGDPEYFFSPENVGIIGYDESSSRYIFGSYITESPDARGGNYNGYERVAALYGMIELPVFASLKLIAGARYEAANMNVYGNNAGGYLNDKDILPSVNFIYHLTEDMNLRASYGKTLARPNFREKAPYANYNFAVDFIFLGNPDLKRTLIDNYDLRWEWFMRPGEIIAVSGFYKHFKNPIERVINVLYTSEGGEIYYDNIEKADLTGIEIELRTNLDRITDKLNHFRVGANFSLIESRVNIPEDELKVIRAFDPGAVNTRPLQGQSPYIFNLDLGYYNPNSGTSVSVIYNVFGDRLAEISVGGTPDVYEKSRPKLNLNISQDILSGFNLKFSVKNIFNSPYKLTHEFKGAEYIRTEYKTGTSFSFGISYSIN